MIIPRLEDVQDREAETGGLVSARNGDVDSLTQYLAAGGNVNAADQSGTSMLHYSVSRGHQECTAVLLKHKADPNLKNVHGDAPLHYCFKHGLAVQLEGLRVSERATHSWPYLILSLELGRIVFYAHPNPLAFLVLQSLLYTPGVQVDARDGSGNAAVHLAAMLGSHEAIALLISKGADLEAKSNVRNMKPKKRKEKKREG